MMSDSAAAPLFSALGRRASPPTIARLMTMALETPGVLSLAAGFTDNATLPSSLVTTLGDELAARSGEPEYLQYGTNQGRPGLRRLLATRLREWEPALDAEALSTQTIITNGSQQALYLAVQVLCDPGDIVLVDRPSYFVFLEMLTGLGVNARSIPTLEDGSLNAAGLKELLRSMKENGEAERLRAVYFVSYFSNPSARSLSRREKDQLGETLAEAGLRVPVLEDAAYRELYFVRPPEVPSVLSSPVWETFPRLYTSTLTKPFATGLKVGYAVCTNPAWLKRMLHVKGHHDFGTANYNQALLERALETGRYDAHLKGVRQAYAGKMQALDANLGERGLRELGWEWLRPEGGLYLWLRGPEGLATGLDSAFCRSCIERGVIYVPGELCFGDDAPRNYVRLSFGVLQTDALAEAARRFVTAAQALR